MSLGNQIKKLRLSTGISRHELSNSLNISYSTLSGYENDSRFPDRKIIIAIVDYFDTTIDYLFERTEYKHFDISNNSNYIDISMLSSNEAQVIKDLIHVFNSNRSNQY